MKSKIKRLVAQKCENLSSERKQSIVASVVASGATDDKIINTLIDQLAIRKKETVLSYAADMGKCPQCKGAYETVYLHNRRPAFYCNACRVCAPKPARNE